MLRDKSVANVTGLMTLRSPCLMVSLVFEHLLYIGLMYEINKYDVLIFSTI